MISKDNTCILIPAFNEGARIKALISQIKALSYFVVVIDDGSRDDTALHAKASADHVILCGVNGGKGAALRQGFSWFLAQKRFEALILMDADGQHDPASLPDFVKALASGVCDIVIGNRMQDPKGMPGLRRSTNHFMSWLISVLAGQSIPDSQCGYRALTRQALQALVLSTSHFEIETEIILEASRHKQRILNIPISSVYRDEKSEISPLRDTMRFIGFLCRFYLGKRG